MMYPCVGLLDRHADERDRKINRHKKMVVTSRPCAPHEKRAPKPKKRKRI